MTPPPMSEVENSKINEKLEGTDKTERKWVSGGRELVTSREDIGSFTPI